MAPDPPNPPNHQLSSMSRFRAKFLRRSSSTSTSLPTQSSTTTTTTHSTTPPASPLLNKPPGSSSPSPKHQSQRQRKRQSHRLSFVSSLLGTDDSDDNSTSAETVRRAPSEKAEAEASTEDNDEDNHNSSSRQKGKAPAQAEAEAANPEALLVAPQPSDQPELRRSPKEDSADLSKNINKPDRLPTLASPVYATRSSTPVLDPVGESLPSPSGSVPSRHPSVPRRPSLAIRRQSLVPASQQRLIRTLLDQPSAQPQATDYFSSPHNPLRPDMVHRKVWVKRLGSSATLVPVTEEDLIDDLRDVILRKYTNSLGKSFDAPDLILRLIPREQSQSNRQPTDRLLGPEEPVGRTLDLYYPGGQSINEALIIEILRKTPKPSPRQNMIYPEEMRPGEAGDYFSPMPPPVNTPPHVPSSVSSASGANPHIAHLPSMSVITTGQVPPLPSPGSRGSWNQHQQHQQQQQPPHRPKYHRQHTTSPTIITTSPSTNLNVEPNPSINGVSGGPVPLPSPPAPVPDQSVQKPNVTPPARVSSPRPSSKPRKFKKNNNSVSPTPALPAGLLDGTVPPINVLIVEDNIINLKLLEAFMKRLKVRWQTAMNGREAVNKWRTGGFHLVLMDIQLPVMNGLDATKEIRRLERLNNIGVFSKNIFGVSSTVGSSDGGDSPQDMDMEPKPEDTLQNLYLFKSPIIIVALTASSLQSDRHEALAAGCNDFLTKPVNFVWLEQKVTEWGCMQALIDFEGWRKWRGFADQTNQPTDNNESMDASDSRSVIERAGKDPLGESALAQRRAVTSKASRAEMTSDDYVGAGPVNVKSAVPAGLASSSGAPSSGGSGPSTNSGSTIVAGGRSPVISNGGGLREVRRGSVPVIVPGRK
ncbi:ssk1 response regulator receiver [Arachnomyces sp. PD_36]|nr:ssk1 response regulator receiver [Arachnomyces sp. PD_36]